MLCDRCKKRAPAIRSTRIAQGNIVKFELCEECAKELIIDRIVAKDRRYPRGAYQFVLAAIRLARDEGQGRDLLHSPSVSAARLLELLHMLALQEFGPRSKAALRGWGIRRCEDFGSIVLNLMEAGLVVRLPEDTQDAFLRGYDFNEAFPES